ncbi:Pr6Pr family membrane protein [Mesoplasma lactucae]|uniref:Uncharacterized protein n=1 Tax=Mesoplasma lactucae ATCC 49193 TaxID=81460 RepID=A0A291IRT1_9MOLU|nr:Pr6Pr family membrane protein [Mesoplasma lactucae]ATG97562.1 hypothetical protein CP520_02230 [Mesoplasma lactucae ATCC 49193]ATZ19979.1 hypothetical protein MLACT_v1c01570 [Mesoplasma lactucae ATCC 49193]MCL8217070.1 hypothetical protein [Mesoplasma lactucae ATCC 49193]
MTEKNYFVRYIKDWRTWYKLFFMLLCATCLIFSLVDGIVNISGYETKLDNGEMIKTWAIQTQDANGNWITHYDYSGNVVQYFSFFTNQSNILVLAWWIIALFFPWKEGKKGLVGTRMTLYTITYISVTMLIYCGMILPQKISSGGGYTGGEWFASIGLHVVGPLAIIIYALFFMNKYVFHSTKNEWLKKKSWQIIDYPAIYGIYILIRGQLRYSSGHTDPQSYPYFFFWIHSDVWGLPGGAWCVIAIIIIFLLLIGLSTLYAFVFNKFRNELRSYQSDELSRGYLALKAEKKVAKELKIK